MWPDLHNDDINLWTGSLWHAIIVNGSHVVQCQNNDYHISVKSTKYKMQNTRYKMQNTEYNYDMQLLQTTVQHFLQSKNGSKPIITLNQCTG